MSYELSDRKFLYVWSFLKSEGNIYYFLLSPFPFPLTFPSLPSSLTLSNPCFALPPRPHHFSPSITPSTSPLCRANTRPFSYSKAISASLFRHTVLQKWSQKVV